ETVEQIPVFSGNGHQSGIPQFLIGVAFFSQGIRQVRPTVRGIADAKSGQGGFGHTPDRKSTRLNSSHVSISYAVFCLTKKKSYASSVNSPPRYSLCRILVR